MRVGNAGAVRKRRVICTFCLRQIARLLQGMAVLHPDRRVVGIAVERLPVEPRREQPLPGALCAVGPGDQSLLAAPPPKRGIAPLVAAVAGGSSRAGADWSAASARCCLVQPNAANSRAASADDRSST